MRASTGTEAKWQRLGVNVRSSTAAEKNGEGMALKIFTEARPSSKAYMKPFGITQIEMLICPHHALKFFGRFINIGNEW